MAKRFAEYGDLYYAPLLSTRLYVTRHPDHIHDILIEKASSFKKTAVDIAARHLLPRGANGLLLGDGELWRRQRSMLDPTLHRRRIESYAQTMVDATQLMLEQWRDGMALDLSSAMRQLTLAIFTQSLLGYGAQDRSGDIMQAMDTFRAVVARPSILPSWLPLPSARRTPDALARIDEIIYRMIDEQLELGKQALVKRHDLLSALLLAVAEEPERGKARQLLRDELLTLFLAGFESTSHALARTFYLLSQHPAVEARLHDEVDAGLGGRPPKIEDLHLLPFTDMVLNEALRLYPPVPVISRTAREDTEIGGYPIQAGAELLMWPYHAYHDPRWFPEPEEFQPERFARSAPPTLPGAFLPFVGGNGLGLGKEFALMEARLVIAMVAQRFRLQLLPGQQAYPCFAATLSPYNGMQLRVMARPHQVDSPAAGPVSAAEQRPRNLETEWLRLGERVKQLARLDAQRAAFGAQAHDYRFGPKLGDAALRQTESRIGVPLPAELRAFYTSLGDGGAGPHYGMRASGKLHDHQPTIPFVGSAALLAKYQGDKSDGYFEAPEEAITGLLEIMTEGCGHHLCIETSGSAPGQVIHVSADGNVVDVAPSLLSLYEKWVEDEIARFCCVHEAMKKGADRQAIHEELKERFGSWDADDLIASIADVRKPESLFGSKGIRRIHGATQFPWYERVLNEWRAKHISKTRIG